MHALAAILLALLLAGPAPAGESPAEPAPDPPRAGRRLEAYWQRPPGCPPPVAPAPGGPGARRYEARAERPPCRLSEPGAAEREWLPEGVWVELPAPPPPER